MDTLSLKYKGVTVQLRRRGQFVAPQFTHAVKNGYDDYTHHESFRDSLSDWIYQYKFEEMSPQDIVDWLKGIIDKQLQFNEAWKRLQEQEQEIQCLAESAPSKTSSSDTSTSIVLRPLRPLTWWRKLLLQLASVES